LPLLSWFEQFEFGDIDSLKSLLDEDVAAVVVEPVQGEGGVVLPPKDFLPDLRRLTSERGVLLILDEVQTGFGRLGYPMAFFEYDVAPDIVTMAKSLGGGVCPIGAVGMTERVMEGLKENPLIHSSPFGGNPLACAAARAVLRVMKEEKLWERARKWEKPVGDFLISLKEAYEDLIADVRGKGLLWGIEFKDSDVGELTVSFLAEERILLAFTLNSPKVLRFEPPLTMEEEHFELFKEAMVRSLRRTREVLGAL
jgi:putrescine aminotransferase